MHTTCSEALAHSPSALTAASCGSALIVPSSDYIARYARPAAFDSTMSDAHARAPTVCRALCAFSIRARVCTDCYVSAARRLSLARVFPDSFRHRSGYGLKGSLRTDDVRGRMHVSVIALRFRACVGGGGGAAFDAGVNKLSVGVSGGRMARGGG